jgi:hypothetical protein
LAKGNENQIAKIDIPIAAEIASTLNLPDPPKAFVNLLGNCSENEKYVILKFVIRFINLPNL